MLFLVKYLSRKPQVEQALSVMNSLYPEAKVRQRYGPNGQREIKMKNLKAAISLLSMDSNIVHSLKIADDDAHYDYIMYDQNDMGENVAKIDALPGSIGTILNAFIYNHIFPNLENKYSEQYEKEYYEEHVFDPNWDDKSTFRDYFFNTWWVAWYATRTFTTWEGSFDDYTAQFQGTNGSFHATFYYPAMLVSVGETQEEATKRLAEARSKLKEVPPDKDPTAEKFRNRYLVRPGD
jgi:hypothetical protein